MGSEMCIRDRRRRGALHAKPKFLYARQIFSFGLSLIPHSIGGVILAMADRLFIGHFEGAKEVGLYSVAYQVGAVMLLVGTSVNQAMAPALFGLLKKRTENSVLAKITLIIGMGYVAFSTTLYFFAELIFRYFVSDKYIVAKDYFPYLLIGFLFQSLYFLFTNYLFYYNRTRLLAGITFGGALLNLGLNYVLIKSYGPIGVAYSTAITWFFYFVAVSFFAVKIQRRAYV